MVQRLSEVMSVALVGNKFWPIPSKISFQVSLEKKSDLLWPDIYKAFNLFDSRTESVSQEW